MVMVPGECSPGPGCPGKPASLPFPPSQGLGPCSLAYWQETMSLPSAPQGSALGGCGVVLPITWATAFWEDTRPGSTEKGKEEITCWLLR